MSVTSMQACVPVLSNLEIASPVTLSPNDVLGEVAEKVGACEVTGAHCDFESMLKVCCSIASDRPFFADLTVMSDFQPNQAILSERHGSLITLVPPSVGSAKEKNKVIFKVSLLWMEWETTIPAPTSFAMASSKGLKYGEEAAHFAWVRVAIESSANKHRVDWRSSPCEITFSKTFERKRGEHNPWTKQLIYIELLAAKAPICHRDPSTESQPRKPRKSPAFYVDEKKKEVSCCKASVDLTESLKTILPVRYPHEPFEVTSEEKDCRLRVRIEVLPNNRLQPKVVMSSSNVLANLLSVEGPVLVFKFNSDCLFQSNRHVAIVPEQTDPPMVCTFYHRKSIFEECEENSVHCIGTVIQVEKKLEALNSVVVQLKLLNPSAWCDSLETTFKDHCDKLKETFGLPDEPVYCVFFSERDKIINVQQAQQDNAAARDQEQARCYRENQDLKIKAIQEKGGTVTLTSTELGTVVLRTGFLLAQPVISSIVQQIMNMPSLELSEKEKNCLHLFRSKEGPWDIFYMFVFLWKLFCKLQKENQKNIFGFVLRNGDVQKFESRQVRINHIMTKILNVRNWWAHVGVSFFDCLNALIALKDFIRMATDTSTLNSETPISIEKSLLENFDTLSKMIDELREQYSCHGSVSLSIDELSHLYFIRACRAVVETCTVELDKGLGCSKLAKELSLKLEFKKEKNPSHRQSGNLEATDVAHVVEKLLQSQCCIPKTTMISFNDCKLIVKARNILAHEPQQSGRVLAVLCALGSVIHLLQFICEFRSCDDTQEFVTSAITKLRFYQAHLLAHINPTKKYSDKNLTKDKRRFGFTATTFHAESIFDVSDLMKRVCLSHSAVFEADFPCKKFVSGDLQMFQFLLNRRVAVSEELKKTFKIKNHRTLMQVAARVPHCYTTTQDAVEFMFSVPSESGILKCTGVSLAVDIAQLHAADTETIKYVVGAIDAEIRARQLHDDALKSFEDAIEGWFERPSIDDEEYWLAYWENKVSDPTLKTRAQETRKTFLQNKSSLENILKSKKVRELKESLVRSIDETITSIMALVPHNVGFTGFLYLQLPNLFISPWAKLRKLLAIYFGVGDSTKSEDVEITSICDPSSHYPFFNIFARKGSSVHVPLFANSLKIMSPLLDYCRTSNKTTVSPNDIYKIEESLESHLLDCLVYLVCLSSASFQCDMVGWYKEKTIQTRISGNWGFLSAVGTGDAKFSGRETEMLKLDSLVRPIFEKRMVRSLVILISGESGMGKTTLAEHFLNTIQNEFFSKSEVFAFSLQGRDSAAVQEGLQYMASVILPVQQYSVSDSLSTLKHFLSSHRYVLFVDDVDRSGLEELLLHAPVSCQGGIILLTSHIDGLSGNDNLNRQESFLFQEIILEKFSEKEAIKLVETVCEPISLQESFKTPPFLENLQRIVGDSCLGFLPIGVRVFSKWLKSQLKNNSVDPLEQWIHEFNCQQQRPNPALPVNYAIQGYRGLQTTVKLCAARLEQLIRKQENCENADEPCDSLQSHFGILWLLSMCKPVQTPWSFFCVPEGGFVRGSMVRVLNEAFAPTDRAWRGQYGWNFMKERVGPSEKFSKSPVGEYVYASTLSWSALSLEGVRKHGSDRTPNTGEGGNLYPIYRICSDKVVTRTVGDRLGKSPNFIEVQNMSNGERRELCEYDFFPCDAEVAIYVEEFQMEDTEGKLVDEGEYYSRRDYDFRRCETRRWRMLSNVDLDSFKNEWSQNYLPTRDNPRDDLRFCPSLPSNGIPGRIIRYHRENETASVLFTDPSLMTGPMSDRFVNRNMAVVARIPKEFLCEFHPDRDKLLEHLKLDVVGLDKTIVRYARTLQKSGLVRNNERNRTFDMHQLLQRAVHQSSDGCLGHFSQNVGHQCMQSLLILQFGSPLDEICYTKRRLDHIMKIINTADAVLRHQTFHREYGIAQIGKLLSWQQDMLMRFHEISIVASSNSSACTTQLLDSAQSLLDLSSKSLEIELQTRMNSRESDNPSLHKTVLPNGHNFEWLLDIEDQRLFADVFPLLCRYISMKLTSSSLLLYSSPRNRVDSKHDFWNLWKTVPHFMQGILAKEFKSGNWLRLVEWIDRVSKSFLLLGDDDFLQHYNCSVVTMCAAIEEWKCFGLWRASLKMRLDCVGLKHPYTARVFHRIARAFLDLNIPEPAVKLLQRAKMIFIESFCDPNYFEIGRIFCDLGRAFELLDPIDNSYKLTFSNRSNSVRDHYKNALRIQGASQAKTLNTFDVAVTLSCFGLFNAREGAEWQEQAIEDLEKAIEIQKSLIAPHDCNPHHFDMHDNRFVLSVINGIRGNPLKAEAYFQNALLDRTTCNSKNCWSPLSKLADDLHSNLMLEKKQFSSLSPEECTCILETRGQISQKHEHQSSLMSFANNFVAEILHLERFCNLKPPQTFSDSEDFFTSLQNSVTTTLTETFGWDL